MTAPNTWQTALDPPLLQRLFHPVRQPAGIQPPISEKIITRHYQWVPASPLLAQLMQRREHGATTQTMPSMPIVYAQPLPTAGSQDSPGPATVQTVKTIQEATPKQGAMSAQESRPNRAQKNRTQDISMGPSANQTVIQAKFESVTAAKDIFRKDTTSYSAPLNSEGGSSQHSLFEKTPKSVITSANDPQASISASAQQPVLLESSIQSQRQSKMPIVTASIIETQPSSNFVFGAQTSITKAFDQSLSAFNPNNGPESVLEKPLGNIPNMTTPKKSAGLPLVIIPSITSTNPVGSPDPSSTPASTTSNLPVVHPASLYPQTARVPESKPDNSLFTLPLAHGVAAASQPNSSSTQSGMLGMTPTSMPQVPVVSASPIVVQSSPSTSEPTPQAQPIDMNRIADQVERRLKRKLTVERERRGWQL